MKSWQKKYINYKLNNILKTPPSPIDSTKILLEVSAYSLRVVKDAGFMPRGKLHESVMDKQLEFCFRLFVALCFFIFII